MPSMHRKKLEQLQKTGVDLPRDLPKDWRAYNEIKDSAERARIKQLIEELHAKHCPSGHFQTTPEGHTPSSRSSRSRRSTPTRTSRSFWG